MKVLILAGLMAAAAAGAALAEPQGDDALNAAAFGKTSKPAAQSPVPHLGTTYIDNRPLQMAGIARTSVDSNLPGDASAAMGFLCGRQAGMDLGGAFAARGYDPSGKFVGAKLSLAFK